MNASIITKPNVKDSVLDDLASELPGIIAGVMEVPGGNVARLKPEQISLEFSQANPRDVGLDIRIMVYARSNDPRKLTENDRAKAILEKVLALIATSGEKYSVAIRLYFMAIGAAEHSLSSLYLVTLIISLQTLLNLPVSGETSMLPPVPKGGSPSTQLPPPETVAGMVIDHADRLHEGVADGCSHEAEAAFFQIAAEGVRQRGAGRNFFETLPVVLDRYPIHKPPQVGVKGTELGLHRQEGAGVADGGGDLEPVTDDADVGQQLGLAGLVKGRHHGRIEPGKGDPVRLALAQDRDPGKPGLGALQDQEFKQQAVIMDRDSPFQIMVGLIERIAARPGAAGFCCVLTHVVSSKSFVHELHEKHEQVLNIQWCPYRTERHQQRITY